MRSNAGWAGLNFYYYTVSMELKLSLVAMNEEQYRVGWVEFYYCKRGIEIELCHNE
jgi:hypothetical protein